MIVHEIYALILDEVVQNIAVAYSYEDINRIARAVYGDNAFAVDCLQYPCVIGDRYINEVFYKADGVTPVQYIPTQEQQMAQLQAENTELIFVLADMIGGSSI